MRWSGLLGWLGAVFIVFGLLSLLLQLATGGLFITRDLPFIWGNFGIGLVLLIVAAVTNAEKIRERLSTGGAKRAGKYGSSAVLSTLLGIVVLSLLAFLTTRYHTRWDWTESGVHTLSDQSRSVVEGLEQDVQFTGFYTPINEPPVKALLDRFAFESERVKVEFVDPQANPARSRALGIEDEKLASGLLHVSLGDESTEIEEVTEENVTNALVKLTRQGTKRVYFLEGHGERAAFEDAASEPEGLSQAIDALRNENYEAERLLLAATGSVPEDADVVVIAGATRPLLEVEHKALRAYAESGGALLVMIDPRANTDIYPLLSEWGIELGDDVVVDRVQGLFGRPVSPFAAQYANHPITEGLREATLFHMARSVTLKPGSHTSLTPLVLTGDQSWGERNLDEFFKAGRAELGPEDLAGPVSLGVVGELPLAASERAEGDDDSASEEEEAGTRLIVYGDSDFATNSMLRQFRNRDLFLNSINWLLGDVEAIAIRPAATRASRLALNTEQFMRLRMLSLFVLPQLIAALGVFVWWWRRRDPVTTR
ncbi:MAG: GldG family protein [Myxococcales bacterium]|nr:GldG family protein [Myxococcales bacterium]